MLLPNSISAGNPTVTLMRVRTLEEHKRALKYLERGLKQAPQAGTVAGFVRLMQEGKHAWWLWRKPGLLPAHGLVVTGLFDNGRGLWLTVPFMTGPGLARFLPSFVAVFSQLAQTVCARGVQCENVLSRMDKKYERVAKLVSKTYEVEVTDGQGQ